MRLRLVIAVLFAMPLLSAPAHASEWEPIGTFEDWYAYKGDENGRPICFMASDPSKSEGNYTRRGEAHLMVAHRPQDKEVGIISFTAGYTYKKGDAPMVTVGDDGFRLFTQGENAFAEPGDDPKLVSAMIAGANLVIEGRSTRGTLTTDTYSLRGFTAAYRAISSACGVQ